MKDARLGLIPRSMHSARLGTDVFPVVRAFKANLYGGLVSFSKSRFE